MRACRRTQTRARHPPTSRTSTGAGNAAGVVGSASQLVNDMERFEEARVAVWKGGAPAHNPEEDKGEGRAHAEQRHEIPDADEDARPVQRRQDYNVDVDHLHEHDPARDQTELKRFLFRLTDEKNRERNEEPADDEEETERIQRINDSPDKILGLFRNDRLPD